MPLAPDIVDHDAALAFLFGRIDYERADRFPYQLRGLKLERMLELASRLGGNETAVKVAIHRLRKRFREFVRAEIAETLTHRELVDEEMRHLIAALRSE